MKEEADKSNVYNDARALRKKVKRVEESRSTIKTKSREKSKVIKAHQDRETELIKNRDDWKAKSKQQEREYTDLDSKYKKVAELFEMKEEQLKDILKEFEELKKVPTEITAVKKTNRDFLGGRLRSWYPFSIILLCIRLVITGASPLRTAANSLKISFQTLPELESYQAPSCTTIKRWVQQVGYYKLTCPKTVANDWMIIIDASIQMGEKKCIVILGCRRANLPRNRALTLEDLEILSMRIVSSLNSNVVKEMLCETASVVGTIIAVCSDRGSEIVRGVKDFQLTSPQTRHIGDTAHRVSNFLEATLEKSKNWQGFRDQVTLSRQKMQHSRIPGALPPSPRAKARYMNMDSLIRWAADVLVLLDNNFSSPGLDVDELRKYLGWLPAYRDDVDYWNRLISIGVAARHVVRTEGIHMDIVESFEQSISSLKMSARDLQFVDQITIFLSEQSKGIKPEECFIGSTEVLESLFGKIKYMEREQRAFGFTSLLLAAMAAVGPLDDKTIIEAMTSVKQSDIDKWTVEKIGQSVQSQRRTIKKIVARLGSKVTKAGQKLSGILERAVA